MWMNSNQAPSPAISPLGRWAEGQIQNNQSFRSFGSSAGSIALSTQQKALITGMQKRNEMKEKPMQANGHRPLSRTTSLGIFPGGGMRQSALNQHRALQRSSSYDTNIRVNQTMPTLGSRPPGLSPITSPGPASISSNTNGYRSRETGVVEKLLVSYGFIKCADREGRLFFHYSQFHGEAHSLNINDEVEFDVSMDTRTGKPVAVQVVKLKKGTVVFEVYSEERILGEVASPAAQNGSQPPMSPTVMNGFKPGEKGEVPPSGKYGSLCYDRMGEVFFLPYSASDLTNKSVQLQCGDKVSFYIATEKRTGILRARKITLVERAPPKRFIGIVTAMKESFGFIERADIVKEIFFHYSEVSNNVPDLHVGDHVEYSIQDRNSKEVATNIRLLPPGTVQLEEISSEIFVGIVEKPLPPKAPNKLQHAQIGNAGGDATTMNKTNGALAAIQSQQPTVTLAGVIQYVTPLGDSRKIRFGEKDRAANCSYTLCKGDKVSFLTVTDKRNGQQRAAGVTLLLEETLDISGEKREKGIVAAVKEGFGFIKCLERDSRLFFHCCELLDGNHTVRMSDEVEFTVLNDPVAEKHRLHATRITILPKGSVIFHTVSDNVYSGTVESLPGTPISLSSECLVSPALGPNPGFISYEDESTDEMALVQIPFLQKDFSEWTESAAVVIGSVVQFHICTLKRTGAKNAVDIRLVGSTKPSHERDTSEVIRDIVSGLSSLESLSSQSTTPLSLTITTSTATSTLATNSLATPRTPILSSPMKMVPLIEDVALAPPTFNLNLTPPRKSKSNEETTSVPSPSKSPLTRTRSATDTIVVTNSPRHGNTIYDSPPAGTSPRRYSGTFDRSQVKTPPRRNSGTFDRSQTLTPPRRNSAAGTPTRRHSANIEVLRSPSSSMNSGRSPRIEEPVGPKVLGWISTLKETYGFIETMDHASEIFFHFSEFQNSQEKYNINTPVMYHTVVKDEKPFATFVCIANEKDLLHEDIDPTIYDGVISKALKSVNPVQPTYQGIIDYDEGKQIKYSPLSLSDRRDFIQVGDKVTFQICTTAEIDQVRAVNVMVKRETIQATIESIKGEYGFINYEVKNSDAASTGKLFFHMSEVREGADEIDIGTLVEFSIVFNQRTGKYSAMGVRCLESKRQRPHRLRLRNSFCDVSGPMVVIIRQPKGPTSDKGFTLKRSVTSNSDPAQLESIPE